MEPHVCNPTYVGRVGKRTAAKAAQVEVQDPFWKLTKAKRTGDMAWVVEYLPNKCKALI
jgi:hypothetical protein